MAFKVFLKLFRMPLHNNAKNSSMYSFRKLFEDRPMDVVRNLINSLNMAEINFYRKSLYSVYSLLTGKKIHLNSKAAVYLLGKYKFQRITE